MNEIVHNYSAGGVVINDDKVLLISSALRDMTGLPKGAIDEGESPELTAIREVKEETGYDAEIVRKLDEYTYEFDWTDGKHHIKTVTYYLMRLSNDLPPKANLQAGEDFTVQWVSFDEAERMLTFDEARSALKLALSDPK